MTTIYGRPVTSALATRMNKLLQKIKPNFGTDIKAIQNSTKKVAVGTYDFAVDAADVNFTNASVSTTAETITTSTALS